MADLEPVQITVPADRAIVHLKSWDVSPIHPSLTPPGLGGDLRVLNLGPGEWLAVSEVLPSPKLKEALDRQLKDDSIAVIDISNGLKVLRVEGSQTRDLLARACCLDLHPEHFAAGRSTRTRLAQLSVVVHCFDSKPRFDLYVGRSYFGYLKSWLTDAAVGLTDLSA
jgi:sarcosine oxidase subunit gamma